MNADEVTKRVVGSVSRESIRLKEILLEKQKQLDSASQRAQHAEHNTIAAESRCVNVLTKACEVEQSAELNKQEIQRLQSIVDELEQASSQHLSIISTHKQKCENLEMKVNSLNSELSSTRAKLEGNEIEAKSWKYKCEMSEFEISSVRSCLSQQVSELTISIKTLTQESKSQSEQLKYQHQQDLAIAERRCEEMSEDHRLDRIRLQTSSEIRREELIKVHNAEIQSLR